MSRYVTAQDAPQARTMAARWEACSEGARRFAAIFGGRFVPTLPHVIAELYDQGEIDESTRQLESEARA